MRATVCVGYAHATAALFWVVMHEIPATADLPGWWSIPIGWVVGLAIATHYTRGAK